MLHNFGIQSTSMLAIEWVASVRLHHLMVPLNKMIRPVLANWYVILANALLKQLVHIFQQLCMSNRQL